MNPHPPIAIVYMQDGAGWRCLAVLPLDRALRFARVIGGTFADVFVTWDAHGTRMMFDVGWQHRSRRLCDWKA